MARQEDRVDRAGGGVEGAEVGVEARVEAPAVAREGAEGRRRPPAVPRTGRQAEAAVAVDRGGDALAHLGLQVRLQQKRQIVMGVGVDEAGGENAAGSVDLPLSPGVAKVPDGGDPVPPDGKVAPAGGPACPVDDPGVAEDDVELAHGRGLQRELGRAARRESR